MIAELLEKNELTDRFALRLNGDRIHMISS